MRPLTRPRACGRRLRYCPRKGTMRGSCGAPAAQAGDRVGASAALELVQARALALVQRDDDLAAALDGDAALLAVVVQPRGALDAQARLQRPRLVVDPGVDDPGVVAGLAG